MVLFTVLLTLSHNNQPQLQHLYYIKFIYQALECVSLLRKSYTPQTPRNRQCGTGVKTASRQKNRRIVNRKINMVVHVMNIKASPIVIYHFQAESHLCTLQCAQMQCHIQVSLSFLTLVLLSSFVFIHQIVFFMNINFSCNTFCQFVGNLSNYIITIKDNCDKVFVVPIVGCVLC